MNGNSTSIPPECANGLPEETANNKNKTWSRNHSHYECRDGAALDVPATNAVVYGRDKKL